ncbi:hypothetical protein PLICRDRAFT_97150 [Plicaturopsis crispa FD-325 SS-3]|nr:hypothetical protein PLICRDRAFT_97150 [Plicaturopsis crispa FD-325 SS-3]
MDLPSTREIELETLLRQRDAQVSELSDEVTRLRRYLSTQPGPSTADPVTLPPALVSILLPHINNANGGNANAGSSSSTVTTALTQRARLLQEENDELYGLLKHGETGRLQEEVRGLRRVVSRLEGALRESHEAITNLSAELDKSYENFLVSARPTHNSHSHGSYSHSQSPPMYRSHLPPTSSNGTSGKLPPTGPRAHKKPRLAESQSHSSPARTNASLPPTHPHAHGSAKPRHSPRPRSNHGVKMEVDEDARTRPRSRSPPGEQERDKELVKERERGRDRDRDGDRDRDRDRARRNGGGGGGGGRRGRRNSNTSFAGAGADRTLKERMGL